MKTREELQKESESVKLSIIEKTINLIETKITQSLATDKSSVSISISKNTYDLIRNEVESSGFKISYRNTSLGGSRMVIEL